MSRILTGIQSTGRPHLGNLLGAILPAIELSKNSANESLLFIADLHSLTTVRDPELLRQNTYAVAAADVHHPRYTWDKKGLVFASGRGTAARVWCMPDLTAPGSIYQVPLPPENNCADEPSIGPPY